MYSGSFKTFPVSTATTSESRRITPAEVSLRIPASVAADAGSQPIPHLPITALASAISCSVTFSTTPSLTSSSCSAFGQDGFDLVATVPSKSIDRDEQRPQLRTIVGTWCHPTADRWRRVLQPADPAVLDRSFSEARYVADGAAEGKRVLLIDDTWTTGGAMQSAAAALRQAGAQAVAGIVIGRHLHLDFEWGSGSAAEEYQKLPRVFDWSACAVHVTAQGPE